MAENKNPYIGPQKKKVLDDPELISKWLGGNWARHKIRENSPIPEIVKSKYSIIPSEVLFGIEFEIENAGGLPSEILNHFIYDEDGSLRNNGAELKFCGKGENLEKALVLYEQFLPAKVEFSPRTSIHVHVDCRNMTNDRMLSFLMLSLLYERLFFVFCGHEREQSPFCVPMYKTIIPVTIRGILNDCAFGTKDFDRKNTLYVIIQNWSKYLGTNILPINTFGTLEFRQMCGHRDMKKLSQWINILGMLKLSTAKRSFIDLVSEVRELNTNSEYEAFTRNLLLRSSLPLLQVPKYERYMEDGVISIKHAFSPLEKLEEFLRSIKEDSSYYKTFPEDAIIHKEPNEKAVFNHFQIPIPEEIFDRNENPRFQNIAERFQQHGIQLVQERDPDREILNQKLQRVSNELAFWHSEKNMHQQVDGAHRDRDWWEKDLRFLNQITHWNAKFKEVIREVEEWNRNHPEEYIPNGPDYQPQDWNG